MSEMPKMTFTVHIFHPGEYQTSVYDYEGWAHPRESYWTELKIQGHLLDARLEAARLRAHEKSYITDEAGTKYEVN